jgi:negative regulator of sigma E activity
MIILHYLTFKTPATGNSAHHINPTDPLMTNKPPSSSTTTRSQTKAPDQLNYQQQPRLSTNHPSIHPSIHPFIQQQPSTKITQKCAPSPQPSSPTAAAPS